MQNTFTPERRLEIYKEAQEKDLDYGLCIVIARVVYGSYLIAPWAGWHKMQQYFPELRHWSINNAFDPTQRREILESAIAEVTELIKSKA
jgi:hypothetical protein